MPRSICKLAIAESLSRKRIVRNRRYFVSLPRAIGTLTHILPIKKPRAKGDARARIKRAEFVRASLSCINYRAHDEHGIKTRHNTSQWEIQMGLSIASLGLLLKIFFSPVKLHVSLIGEAAPFSRNSLAVKIFLSPSLKLSSLPI